ncbi:hypothetical protein E7T06_08335 [Deinococcus sp. Arct2-2]|uniref:hypothetical protein n=1 Tax=Deinococcus sp. Arct2-2 TaxID=2568653 RepID=UPI0010A592A7|nr:hypothetical protein [Deinococcus sp. Arct2-2]THF70184.1 hypothetical protein E7T06_08335 [Deinococcus sp. Arct2-2]
MLRLDGRKGLGISTDAPLTNIALYWLTNMIGSSVQLCRENRREPVHFGFGERVQPPFSTALFPHGLPMPPRSWVERVYNRYHWTPMARGGHFTAIKQSELLAEDIRQACCPLAGTALTRENQKRFVRVGVALSTCARGALGLQRGEGATSGEPALCQGFNLISYSTYPN